MTRICKGKATNHPNIEASITQLFLERQSGKDLITHQTSVQSVNMAAYNPPSIRI